MTKTEAALVLMTEPDIYKPIVWEAYEIVYGRKHRLDPDLPEEEQLRLTQNRYKRTAQEFDEEAWPLFTWPDDVFGMNNIGRDPIPYAKNPLFFLGEEDATFLATQLSAKVIWVDGPKGPFSWPGSWWLQWETGDQRNAGIVAHVWNQELTRYKAHISRWNLNLGTNNATSDPQLNTPDLRTIHRIEIGANVDLDGDGEIGKKPRKRKRRK